MKQISNLVGYASEVFMKFFGQHDKSKKKRVVEKNYEVNYRDEFSDTIHSLEKSIVEENGRGGFIFSSIGHI